MNKIDNSITINILNYLKKNPDAGDTLEGIAKWWLEFVKVDLVVDKIAETLDYLIKQGLVKKIEHGDREPIYRVCNKN